jgi:hypothetical protein
MVLPGSHRAAEEENVRRSIRYFCQEPRSRRLTTHVELS